MKEYISKYNKVICGVLYLMFFTVVFMMNWYQQPVADEWAQNVIGVREGFGFDYAINSYYVWNARIGEFLFRLFIWNTGPDIFYTGRIFGIVNSFVFTGLTINVFYIIKGYFPKFTIKDPILFLWIFVLLYRATYFNEVFVWQPGAMGYGWALFFYSCFALPYAQILYHKNDNNNILKLKSISFKYQKNYFSWQAILKSIVFFCISIPIGMGSEITTPLILIALAIIFFCRIIVDKEIPPLWFFMGGIALFIGWCLIMISPGSNARNAAANVFVPIQDQNLLIIFQRFIQYSMRSYIFWNALVVLAYIGVVKFKNVIKDYRIPAFYIFLGGVGLLMFSLLSIIESRTYSTAVIFFILASAYIGNMFAQRIPKTFTIITILLFAFICLDLKEYHRFNEIVGGHFIEIEEQKSKGIRDIKIYTKQFYSPIITAWPIYDTYSWIQAPMARYFEVDNIEFFDPETKETYRRENS